MPAKRKRHRGLRTSLATDLRYLRSILREFRWTILAMVSAIVVGGCIVHFTPESTLGGENPSWMLSFYDAWMAMFAQPVFTLPDTWYLALMAGVYPLFGVLLIGEGLVRFALLMVSRRRGEKEWMLVMASTYRNHVILCGLGHLGFRVLVQLIEQGRQVVAIEKDGTGRFVEEAKETGASILIRDVKEDEALVQAGIAYADSIIIATDDDLANLEVALDAKRMNPKIRTAVRMFDQAMASKLKDTFQFDFAFSPSALAAPTVAAMSLGSRVISAFPVAGHPNVVAEVDVQPGCRYAGQSVSDVENATRLRVLGRTTGGQATLASRLASGDVLVVGGTVDDLGRAMTGFNAPTSDRS
jgi:voltage-gated potassium channel